MENRLATRHQRGRDRGDTRAQLTQLDLGSQGLQVSAQGIGVMGMTGAYGHRDEADIVSILNLALDLGVTLIDTADSYGPFVNDELVGRILRTRRDEVVLSTKFGTDLDRNEVGVPLDGRPEHVRRALDRSLTRLGTDDVDLYILHRVDQRVPIEDTVGAMGELVQQGKVKYLGLSEACPSTIRRAHKTFPLTAVQSEYSLLSRDVETNGVLTTVRELGVGFVASSPLGRGLLSSSIKSLNDLGPTDSRRLLPRFRPGALEANVRLLRGVEAFSKSCGMTLSQMALAWSIAKGVVPIPGSENRRSLKQNVAAADFSVSAFDILRLEELVPARAVSGPRDIGASLRNMYR